MLQKKKLIPIFRRYNVRNAYLFGSTASGNNIPESDVDIAVMLPEKYTVKKRFDIRLKLTTDLNRYCGGKADVVVLNDTKSLFFQYVIIKEGILLYEKSEEERVDYEMKTMNRYFDFQPFLELYNRQYVKNSI